MWGPDFVRYILIIKNVCVSVRCLSHFQNFGPPWPILMKLCMHKVASLTMSKTRKKNFDFAKNFFRFFDFTNFSNFCRFFRFFDFTLRTPLTDFDETLYALCSLSDDVKNAKKFFSISRIFPIFVEFIILADEVKNSQNEIFLIFLIFRFHYFFQFLSNSSFWPLRRKFRQKIAKMKFPNNKKRLSVSLSGTDFSKTTWPNLMTLCMRYLHSLTMSNTRKKIFYFAKKIFRFHEFFPEFFRTHLFGRLDRFRQTQCFHT